MIQKFRFGTPIPTDATVEELPIIQVTEDNLKAASSKKKDCLSDADLGGLTKFFHISLENGFSLSLTMADTDAVYGLGQANRGINKRGYKYISCCTDDPNHTEEKVSFYGAHNFVMLIGKESFGLFIDYPADVCFDIGYTKQNELTISTEGTDLDLYLITCAKNSDNPENTVSSKKDALCITGEFRRLIGQSYIPPLWAFGYIQSRWGYMNEKDIRRVAKNYRDNHLPLDSISMDIDYMEDYKDFTVHPERFPSLSALSAEMSDQGLHFIPIIDAGVKIEKGYDVYEDGVKNNYFCKREDGTDFVAGVWPGKTHFPDFLNADARRWFGDLYKRLTDQGIEGFWNDMNEPAIFYSPEGIAELKEMLKYFLENEGSAGGMTAGALACDKKPGENDDAGEGAQDDMAAGASVWPLMGKIGSLANSKDDYRRFYHNVNGQRVRHDKVHNLFGYYMTRAAGEAFERIDPDKRFLMFSRSSYIGMHRYGGIWMGDNKSWWSHILLNLKMLPSLNMCGFLYTGADLGGFGANATRDMVMRWLALGVFTPLMRNHAAQGTREQECYQFEDIEDFRHVIGVRYRLIPYLYSEYMKAALNDDLYFKPLAFVYPEDQMALQVEDQLMLGNEIMIAPVYTQNAKGRYVYLPEEMKFVKFLPDGTVSEEILEKGHHYVEIALNEVPLFIRSGKCLPVAKAAEYVDALDTQHMEMLGYEGAEYELYEDDGVSKEYEKAGNYRTMKY